MINLSFKKVLVVFSVMSLMTGSAMAATTATNNAVKLAIRKYKVGNYTGCLQDMQRIVKTDPSNSVAYYYIGAAYTQCGKKDDAIKAYSKVLTLKPNATLYQYASRGKTCLETPDACKQDASNATDLDKFISSPYGDGLSPQVKADLEKKNLEKLQNTINNGGKVDEYKLQQFRKFDKSENDVQPTSEQIAEAMKVLTNAGYQVSAAANSSNPYTAALTAANAQNPQMAEMSMWLNSSNGGNNNNNNALNMLPMMLAQSSQNGQKINPQMIQAMMMQSMMPNMDFSGSNNK